jgi:hypothetical protein
MQAHEVRVMMPGLLFLAWRTFTQTLGGQIKETATVIEEAL